MSQEQPVTALRTVPRRTYVAATPAAWTEQGLCVGRWERYDTPEGTRTTPKQARALCMGCPVKAICLDDAIEAEGTLPYTHRQGIRGGATPMERAKISKLIALADSGTCPCGEHEYDEDLVNWNNDYPLCRIQVHAQPSSSRRRKPTRRRDCPVCGESQGSLARHIARRHPEYETEAA